MQNHPAPSIKSTAPTHTPRVSLTGQRGTYLVQSSTDASVFYTTTACSCTCPARKPCKHMTFVKRLNAAFYVPKVSPATRPQPRPAGFAGLDEAFGVAS